MEQYIYMIHCILDHIPVQQLVLLSPTVLPLSMHPDVKFFWETAAACGVVSNRGGELLRGRDGAGHMRALCLLLADMAEMTLRLSGGSAF